MSWASPFALQAAERLPFAQAIERIEASLRFGIDPSLAPIRCLLAELGHPEYSYECVQVAGTNGKTSTSRYTAALLHAQGRKVGLYTSPHLVSYTERVEVDGEPVGEELFALGVSYALAAWERIAARDEDMRAQGVTEFELLTAAALVMYALEDVNCAVLEVGLGGRWDATSAVPTVGCALTGVALDHTAILGNTLAKIAREKAAVIHPGIPVVLGPSAVSPAEVLEVVSERCEDTDVRPCVVSDADHPVACDPDFLASDADLTTFVVHASAGDEGVVSFDVHVAVDVPDVGFIEADYPQMTVRGPVYQPQNAACALSLATAVLARPIPAAIARQALLACPVPGRFQTLRTEPLAIVDACHNPQSAEAFCDAVRAAFPDAASRPTLLIGALADKDHAGIVERVVPLFNRVVVTQSDSGRAFPAADLAAEIEGLCGVKPAAVYGDARSALDALCGESFIACGTITLIGEIAAILA